jgi:hypothetical protein
MATILSDQYAGSMPLKVQPLTLTQPWCRTQCLALIPEGPPRPIRAVYSHGYTASKSDCLPWAIRAAESGIPAIIFDWPGHYLGGLNEVARFEDFTAHAHTLFATAWDALDALCDGPATQAILGGHSLGALMAIKALPLPRFQGLKRLGVGLGIGLNHKVETHLFDTSFYQKTLSVRRQLVSPALDSDAMFPWIRDEKGRLALSGERVHLITGQDDLVVGDGGMEAFAEHLRAQGNVVTTFAPSRMAHHEPTAGAPHLHAFLKTELGI